MAERASPQRLRSRSTLATERHAARLVRQLPDRFCLHLAGELGVGKTTFARGALRACGVAEAVASPSYGLVNTYTAGRRRIAHLDLYRCSGGTEWLEAGLAEELEAADITLVEWPERGAGLPHPDLLVTIVEGPRSGERVITVDAVQ